MTYSLEPPARRAESRNSAGDQAVPEVVAVRDDNDNVIDWVQFEEGGVSDEVQFVSDLEFFVPPPGESEPLDLSPSGSFASNATKTIPQDSIVTVIEGVDEVVVVDTSGSEDSPLDLRPKSRWLKRAQAEQLEAAPEVQVPLERKRPRIVSVETIVGEDGSGPSGMQRPVRRSRLTARVRNGYYYRDDSSDEDDMGGSASKYLFGRPSDDEDTD